MQNISKYVEENKLKLTQNEILNLFNDREKNKNKIIKSQLPLVLLLAGSYSSTTNYSVDDLFSYGLEGLTNALYTFKIDTPATFTTYANKCIKTALNGYVYHNTTKTVIKQPSSNFRGITIPKAYLMTELSDDEYNFEEKITDSNEPKKCNEEEIYNLIYDCLKPSYAYIVTQYLGINEEENKTFNKIAEEQNKTRENIRQQYHKAIQILKDNEDFKYHFRTMFNL